jgi:hypothetical protein
MFCPFTTERRLCLGSARVLAETPPGRANPTVLYLEKVRDREDALGPSRTGISTREACALQITRH